jgi:hypothetical protein
MRKSFHFLLWVAISAALTKLSFSTDEVTHSRSPVTVSTQELSWPGGSALPTLQNNLIGTDPEEVAQFSNLLDTGHPPAALPQIDRLGLHTHLQRQLELCPPLLEPMLPNGFHYLSLRLMQDHSRWGDGPLVLGPR